MTQMRQTRRVSAPGCVSRLQIGGAFGKINFASEMAIKVNAADTG